MMLKQYNKNYNGNPIFVAKAYLLSSLKFYQGDVYLSRTDGIYLCKISV